MTSQSAIYSFIRWMYNNLINVEEENGSLLINEQLVGNQIFFFLKSLLNSIKVCSNKASN